jgi:hypothetical protein
MRVAVFRVLAVALAGLQLFSLGNLVAPWNTAPALAVADRADPDAHAWRAAPGRAVRLLFIGGDLGGIAGAVYLLAGLTGAALASPAERLTRREAPA